MQVTRLSDARPYQAPGHFDVCALRLQGMDASAAGFAWVGLSHFLPGGGTEMGSSPQEKIYVVLAGEIRVTLANGDSATLGPMDSCYIPGGEARAVLNPGNAVATMLVVMPGPGSAS